MALTYEVFTYNGELDILRLHLSIMSPFVDKFIICESKKTFSGYKKPLYFFQHQRYVAPWWDKIIHYVIPDEFTPEEIGNAHRSPNTVGAKHWTEEFCQKEHLQKALIKAKVKDDDTVIIGDVDEIIDMPIAFNPAQVTKIKLKVYAYYLNNRSSEEFWGPIITPYKNIKGKCLNHIRSSEHVKSKEEYGWHFTSMGGLKEVQRKLNDSYTTESYNTASVQAMLPKRHREAIDYLGRDFKFKVDDSEWPQFLKEHRKNYEHLCL